MCQTMISDVDDMDEITSTCHKKTGKLIEPRKIRKPLMEKKRRARINQSLDELKRIVVEAEKLAGQDLSRVNKLEKADILEMTVRYLKRNRTTATAAPDVYLAGYRQCMEQVQDLLAEQWTDERRRQSGRRMVEHLEVCVRRLNVPPPRNHRLVSSSSSDDDLPRSTRHDSPGPVAATATATAAVTNAASSDDDSVEDEPLAARPPSPADRTTTPQFRPRDTTTKSTWRPW